MLRKSIFLLILATPTWATYSGYTYRKTLSIPTSKISATDGTSISNFPVLISLNDNTLSTTTASGGRLNSTGYDLVFSTKEDCSFILNWDTETVQNVGVSTMNVWVKIPTLSTTTDVASTFFMCYGNSGVTTYQGISTNTWDSNFKGVWHFPDGKTLTALDSTSNGNAGSLVGPPTPTAGQIDGAGAFDGSSQYVNMGNVLDQTGSNPLTLSAWFNSSYTGNNPLSLISKDMYSGTYAGWEFGINVMTASSGDRGKIGFQPIGDLTAGPPDYFTVQGTSVYNDGAWHYAVVTYDGSKNASGVNLYVDTVLQSVTTSGQPSTIASWSNTHNYEIGGRDGTNNVFSGSLDEGHHSSVVRTVDWIKTEYNNQSSPSTFVIVSGETTQTGPIGRGVSITGGRTKISSGRTKIQ